MKLFDVYPRYDINLVRGEGCWVYDDEGTKYLDLYGGHAVISIGHSHVRYVDRITNQLSALGFYSNSVQMDIQEEYARKLGRSSGYPDYQLFLCNSGAEANENAMKLASFHTGRKKIIVFEGGFHGRTSLAVEATDNPGISAPINETKNIIRLPFNDIETVRSVFSEDVAAVMIEGIQGISGIHIPDDHFLRDLQWLCHERGALLILDEIQSGFGRSGEFFAHQYADVRPDIISMAKGMGNGFPIGGILIAPHIASRPGMLGTTFGGNPLACAAGLAVLEVLESKKLLSNAMESGEHLLKELENIPGIESVRGRGLMIGIDLILDAKEVRKELLFKHKIFTGSATSPNTLRVLPPLKIEKEQLDHFLEALKKVLKDETISIGK